VPGGPDRTMNGTGTDVDFYTWRNNLQKLPNGKYQYVKPIDISDGSGIMKTRGLSSKIGGEGFIEPHDEPVLLKTIDYSDEQAVMDELLCFENEVANSDIEIACVITKNGEVYRCFGVIDAVYPDYDLGDKLFGATISHNHLATETSYSFSDVDFGLFTHYKLELLRGFDFKYAYELAPRGVTNIDDLDWQDYENYQHEVIIEKSINNRVKYRRWKR